MGGCRKASLTTRASVGWNASGRYRGQRQNHCWFLWQTKPRQKEAYRLTEAALQGKFDLIPALGQEVQRNTAALQEFKAWLTQNRIRATLATPEELERKVESALREWLANNPSFASQAKELAKAQANPERYLGQLYESCAYIDIRGLHVGSGRAHRFPIEDLYIELDTTGGGKLKHTLAHRARVVLGDPGVGKTTFLRWIAHTLAGDRLGVTDNAAKELLGLARPLIPVFVSIAEWLEHVAHFKPLPPRKAGAGWVQGGRFPPLPLGEGWGEGNHQSMHTPATTKDPQWLVHFLSQQSASRELGLDAAWFKEKLNQGDCLLLFDGLDEAPDRKAREFATNLLEAVASTWKDCLMLVTSRPSGYQDRTVLPNFEPSHIEALGERAVETFLDRWSRALHPDNTKAADTHCQELLQALNARPNIRRLARNTVMLTALAVVHWNEKRLPEQRAELYESILLWLARSREQRPGRAGSERSLEILRTLTLAMQNAKGGRKIQVTRHWAAEQIADLFPSNRPTKPPRPLGDNAVELSHLPPPPLPQTGEGREKSPSPPRGEGLGRGQLLVYRPNRKILGRRGTGQRHHCKAWQRSALLASQLSRIPGGKGHCRSIRATATLIAARNRTAFVSTRMARGRAIARRGVVPTRPGKGGWVGRGGAG